MAEIRRGFTFICKIEDFNLVTGGYYSPYFFVPATGGTEYQLCLYTNFFLYEDLVACFIIRSLSDTGPDQPNLDYELSFLSNDGKVLQSKVFLKGSRTYTFSNRSPPTTANSGEALFLEKDPFLSNDTFTVCCRMWKKEDSATTVERCLVKARSEREYRTAIGTIEKFSCLESENKHPVTIKSTSPDNFFIDIKLSISSDTKINIEIDNFSGFFSKIRIFILDKYENKVKSGQIESVESLIRVPFTFSKDYLMRNKEFFLPNDELKIYCEIVYSSLFSHEIEYTFDYEDTPAKNTDVNPEEHHIENLSTLKDDWILLFREGILCDTKLTTASETFPAHSVVLSARSPVFKSMFTTDMKEKTNKCVEIDDLDADTVRRMLLFMYSDTLDNLTYESANGLYFASDKYNIVSLRQRCSNFLKQNLLQSNCLDILLLADNHQDKDLKDAVHNYITKNDDKVLFSDEWRSLEENQPRLTTEVFRLIYMKKLKK